MCVCVCEIKKPIDITPIDEQPLNISKEYAEVIGRYILQLCDDNGYENGVLEDLSLFKALLQRLIPFAMCDEDEEHLINEDDSPFATVFDRNALPHFRIWSLFNI